MCLRDFEPFNDDDYSYDDYPLWARLLFLLLKSMLFLLLAIGFIIVVIVAFK